MSKLKVPEAPEILVLVPAPVQTPVFVPEVSAPEPLPAPIESPPPTEEKVEIPSKLFFFTDLSSDIEYLEMLYE